MDIGFVLDPYSWLRTTLWSEDAKIAKYSLVSFVIEGNCASCILTIS